MNWYKEAQDKVMYIVRGLPGSGKSSLAKKLSGPHGQSFSTDDFFMVGDEYQYNEERIVEAHQWNIERAKRAAEQGISPIVIDNTNVQFWHFQPYVDIAEEFGYQVKIEEPTTDWARDPEELARRNKHKVPETGIREMLDKWETEKPPEQGIQ
tara:strand:+ start:31 stop:489 length:459 start_codon:yes stop_codon:yes gene_type:complete